MNKKTIFWAGVALVAGPVFAQSCLVDPVRLNPNVVTSTFGKTRNLEGYNNIPRTHWGTDFRGASSGGKLDVLAVDNGVVVGSGWYGQGYGNRVALQRENGDIVTYNHLSKVDPSLKGAGFGSDRQFAGALNVKAGALLGVAGGTASHGDAQELTPHLHLEYLTGYAGTRLREVNGGSAEVRSRYLRNPESYLCHAPTHAPGAGPAVAAATGGQPPEKAQAIETAATQPSVTDREHWGIPDAAPFASYKGMSESQIMDAELSRRMLDTEWETKLVGMGERGLWMEISRMRGVKLWLEGLLQEKHTRTEAMIASMLAFETNRYFNPKLAMSYAKVSAVAAAQKVK